MKDIKQLAENLGLAIKESLEFKAYEKAKATYDLDESLQSLIKEFNLKKMSVTQEMQNETKDETKLSKYQEEMRTAYADVISHPVMIAYSEAKDNIEHIVNDIYGIINYYVTGQEPGGCSGSCSECEGCH